ncbi:MAG TPA: 3-oxoacyl-ACP reductase [Baekduia sp.]|nr:3-oxoacyl-ACP reductase [Baekduia sp.]
MSLYEQVINTPVGRIVAKNTPLPQPAVLDRWTPGQPVVDGVVLTGAATGGRLGGAVAEVLEGAGVTAATEPRPNTTVKGLVFDATGIKDSTELEQLYTFVHESIRSLAPSGRLLVLGTPMEAAASPREATAQRALEGFVRSAAKELRAGATAQLVKVHPGAEDHLASTLRFLLSPKSAYVNAQVVEVGEGTVVEPDDWEKPLAGKVALVTGASRGIGAAIAEVLARDGAKVVGLDIPALKDDLQAVTKALGGRAVTLDITAADAPQKLAKELSKTGVDVVVHNAGITKDVTLARMPAERWRAVLDVNLSAQERINDALLDGGVLNKNGRIVCVSSISGIAGNAGQANYAASKAGVIGMVRSLAPVLAQHGATINAVAPGFIETQMTAKVPIVIREAGRRMNSLSQGGLPVDVAETIAWFASPGSGGVNGNVVRVCGQSLLGA